MDKSNHSQHLSPIRTSYLTARPVSPSTLPVELQESPFLRSLRKDRPPSGHSHTNRSEPSEWVTDCRSPVYNKYHATNSVLGGVKGGDGRMRDVTHSTSSVNKQMKEVRAYEAEQQRLAQEGAHVQRAHWERLRSQQGAQQRKAQQMTFMKKKLRAARIAATEERQTTYADEREDLLYDTMRERGNFERLERQSRQDIYRERWIVNTSALYNSRRQRLQENEHAIRMEACGFFILDCEAKFRIFIGKHAAVTRTALLAEERSQRVSRWKYLNTLYSWKAEQEAEIVQVLSLERKGRSRVADEEVNGFGVIDGYRMDLMHAIARKQRQIQEAANAAVRAKENEQLTERRGMDGKEGEGRANIRMQETVARATFRQTFDAANTLVVQAVQERLQRELEAWKVHCASQIDPLVAEETIERDMYISQRRKEMDNLIASAAVSWEDASHPCYISLNAHTVRQPLSSLIGPESAEIPFQQIPLCLPTLPLSSSPPKPALFLASVSIQPKDGVPQFTTGCELIVRACPSRLVWGDTVTLNRDREEFQVVLKQFGLVAKFSDLGDVELRSADTKATVVECVSRPFIDSPEVPACQCEDVSICHTTTLIKVIIRNQTSAVDIVNALMPLLELKIFSLGFDRELGRVLSTHFTTISIPTIKDIDALANSETTHPAIRTQHRPLFVECSCHLPLLVFQSGGALSSQLLETPAPSRTPAVAACPKTVYPFIDVVVAPVKEAGTLILSASGAAGIYLGIEGFPVSSKTGRGSLKCGPEGTKMQMTCRTLPTECELIIKCEVPLSNEVVLELLRNVKVDIAALEGCGEVSITAELQCGNQHASLTAHYLFLDTSTRGAHLLCPNPCDPLDARNKITPLADISLCLVPARPVIPPLTLTLEAAVDSPFIASWSCGSPSLTLDSSVSVMSRPADTLRNHLINSAKRKPTQVTPAGLLTLWVQDSNAGKWIAFTTTTEDPTNLSEMSSFPAEVATAYISSPGLFTVQFSSPSITPVVTAALEAISLVVAPVAPLDFSPKYCGALKIKNGTEAVVTRPLHM